MLCAFQRSQVSGLAVSPPKSLKIRSGRWATTASAWAKRFLPLVPNNWFLVQYSESSVANVEPQNTEYNVFQIIYIYGNTVFDIPMSHVPFYCVSTAFSAHLEKKTLDMGS